MPQNVTLPTSDTTETICAIATAPGGALGIVRVSGPQAIDIIDHIFKPAAGAALKSRKANTITFGNISDKDGHIVDEVLVSLFRAPHSYTGEDSVEISCHGSSYILHQIIALLIAEGARLARPGEYTQRAFANGKMDLSQAEAVADLIAAKSAASHRIALNQMRGNYSSELQKLREQLVHFTSLLELELDFSDHEDLEFADRTELENLAQRIETRLSQLCQSYSWGNVLKNGIPVAIVGDTNVGKSTLLNALLGEERAIVSDVHGTTRDVIEDTVTINGITFRFIDTAGIRHTSDTVESMGISRTFSKIEQAEIILWLLDITQAESQFSELAPRILPLLKPENHLVVVLNKIDKCENASVVKALTEKLQSQIASTLQISQSTKVLPLSAHPAQGIESLRTLLAALPPQFTEDDIVVSNARHYEALSKALESITRVRAGLATQLSSDFISQDLRECLFHLSDIVGEVTTNEILNSVFSSFCVGK